MFNNAENFLLEMKLFIKNLNNDHIQKAKDKLNELI